MRITIAVGDNEAARLLFKKGKIQVTEADLLFAGEREIARIQERTAKGLDYLERPFAPYSRNGPYYYYPTGVTGRLQERQAIASRMLDRLAPGMGRLTKQKAGIRFASYGDFKLSLGRMNPDLMGPRAPHMMQALVAQVINGVLWFGIWGAQAAKAQGHNEGIRNRLPQRRFLDVSPKDLNLIGTDLTDILAARLMKPSYNWTLTLQ